MKDRFIFQRGLQFLSLEVIIVLIQMGQAYQKVSDSVKRQE